MNINQFQKEIIKELINELKLNIRINKQLLKEKISSLWSFFVSDSNYFIINYQDEIQNCANEIFILDNTINAQENKLLEYKKDIRYYKEKVQENKEYQQYYYNNIRKYKFAEKQKPNIKSYNRESYFYKPVVDTPTIKPISIDRTKKFILEI